MEYEICNEENAQEFTNIDSFIFISSSSDFSLYPDIFADSNLSPLCINVIPQNIDVGLNKFPISFYQDRETIIDHSSDINEHVFHKPSCFDTSYGSEENFNECCEANYDDYSNIEDVDSYSILLNHHDQSKITCEN